MKQNVLAVALALMASIGAYAEKNTVSSPDGKLNVVVEDHDGKLYYSISYAGKQMMDESQLGLLANVGDFSQGLTYQSKKEAKVEKSYDLRTAKFSHVGYHANQLNVTYINGKKQPMTVTFNVSNNDVAFRYTFDQLKAQHIIVNEEKTAFNLPKVTTTYLCPQSDPLIGFARTKPSYEEDYKVDQPLTAKSGYGHGYTFPCLFKVGADGWVLVSETGTHGNYPGCHISDYDAAKGYQIAFPMEKEADGIGSTSGTFILPGSTPWRTITVGSDLKPLVETTIPYDVVEPRFEASQKYGTGKYAWSWLIWQDAEDKIQDVFKRYYQLSDSQDSHQYGWGSGIGLYYVKRLVELHHGEIHVKNIHAVSETSSEASLRNGVEFYFSLPADKSIYNKVEIVAQEKRVMQIPLEVKSEEGRTLEVKSEEGRVKNSLAGNTSAPSKNLPRILIVDDDVDVAAYLHQLFASDYEVVNRYSAEGALADLEEVKPDIILSDIIMGEMSGLEFCKTLKGNLSFSHIPVVLITAMASMHNQIDGLKLGAVAYVTKPFDPAYLKALVKSQLQNIQMLRQRLGESTKTDSLAENVADTLSPQDRKFMDEVYEMMEKLLAQQDLNVNSMCRDMFISPSKFNYKIKELTGETPGIFFRKYKLNKAAQMLHDGLYSISEVAVLTGFSTAAHFSVAFKKQFGISPSDYH